MSHKILFLSVVILIVNVNCQVCPKQCDCDIEKELNRALCVDQNIVSISVGVPKEVQVYSLSRNVISELDNYCFKELGYTSILILNLSYNFISWIGLHAFAALDKLKHLDLSNNRLRYLSPDLFWDTPELEYLDLSGNVFETLKNEPFLMHDKLQVLNLNNCRIKSLPDRLFKRLPNLRQLDLSENYMISITVEVLNPLKRLHRLELRSEYWQCTNEFIELEQWIVLHKIEYQMQCRKKLPKMYEKMISMHSEEMDRRRDVDIHKIWNYTNIENNTEIPRNLTKFQKFDDEFPSFQAFLMGLELGLAVGILGTYMWLRNVCKCGHLKCKRPQSRRELRRARLEGDMRTNLLWSNVTSLSGETPPSHRRHSSLPDGGHPCLVYGVPGFVSARVRQLEERSESPPPPYQECTVNL